MNIEQVNLRLHELSKLTDGWYEGGGYAPSKETINRAKIVLLKVHQEDPEVTIPSIFPTPEGGIQMEWSLDGWDIEVRIQPESELVHGFAIGAKTEREFMIGASSDLHELLAWLQGEVE